MGEKPLLTGPKSDPCVSVACVVTLAVTITLSVTFAVKLALDLTYKLNLDMMYSRRSTIVIPTRSGSCCDYRYDVGHERRATRNSRRNQRVDYEVAYPAYDYYPRPQRARRRAPPPPCCWDW